MPIQLSQVTAPGSYRTVVITVALQYGQVLIWDSVVHICCGGVEMGWKTA